MTKAFIDGKRDLQGETASQLWQSSSNWSYGVLKSVILIILGTINFQFQNLSVSIFLRPILSIVTAMPCLQSGPHVVNFFHLGGFQYL